MNDNTNLWDKLGKTDPAHTKTFKRAGGFSGTAIKPMFSYRRMTEEFGPCGIGWGVNEPSFQIVNGSNSEVLVYCTVSIWYDGVKGKQVFGVGGDKVVTYIKANDQYNRPERWESDDEAFKKAFTDAVTNALKLIGVGADVHMGMFDDNKYVNTVRQEFADQHEPEPAKRPANQLKKDGAWEGLITKLDAEMSRGPTLVEFDTEMKRWFWNEGKKLGFNDTWMEQLKDELLKRRADIEAAQTVAAIKEEFPGAHTVNEQHVLEAGE